MKSKMSFQERAQLATELLSDQPATTLEQAKLQGKRLQMRSSTKDTKKSI